MIYDNYQKNKNLMAVKISINNRYTNLWYKISNDPYTQVGTINRDEDFIEVELVSINEFGWNSDITRARISVEKNGKPLIGRDMETNKNIISNSGIDINVYDYLNVSKSEIDKMIKFFKSEYIKKYPEMSSFKYFNYMRILEIDKELKNNLTKNYNDNREKYETDRKNIELKFQEILDKEAKFQHEDIYDYFIDIIDHLGDTILDKKPTIGISRIIDNNLVTLRKNFYSTVKNDLFYINKLDSKFDGKFDGIKPNKIYYYIEFEKLVSSLFDVGDEDDFTDESDYIGKGSINYEELTKFVESKYNLSLDKKLNSNRTFKLISIGDKNPIMKSYLKTISFNILLEQI